jgi:O-succinylbenzoic acid--CoA ligase
MQLMRSLLTQGQLAIVPFRDLLQPGLHPLIQQHNWDWTDWYISLVPTQLQRLLQQAQDYPSLLNWLQQFRVIFVGGAPAWPSLLRQARAAQLRLALTYGMTETASQIATLNPVHFLQGQNHCGPVLPHAQIQIVDAQGAPCPIGTTGQLCIQARSLCLGYYPSVTQDALQNQDGTPCLYPDDLGYFDTGGHLHIVGRCSHKIISGGENIYPQEVEQCIQATELVEDVAVLGVPDPDWGEMVVACYVPAHDRKSAMLEAALRQAVRQQLSPYKCPKQWLGLLHLPRNSQGKLNYQQLRQIVRDRLLNLD